MPLHNQRMAAAIPAEQIRVAQMIDANPSLRAVTLLELGARAGAGWSTVQGAVASYCLMLKRAGQGNRTGLYRCDEIGKKLSPFLTVDQAIARFASQAGPSTQSASPVRAGYARRGAGSMGLSGRADYGAGATIADDGSGNDYVDDGGGGQLVQTGPGDATSSGDSNTQAYNVTPGGTTPMGGEGPGPTPPPSPGPGPAPVPPAPAPPAVVPPDAGGGMGTVLVLGAVALAAVLFLKRKKKKAA